MAAVKRRLFNILAGMSLLLCVAMVTFWVRSYWFVDEAYVHASGSRWDWYFVSYPGQWFIQIGYDYYKEYDPKTLAEERGGG